MPAGESIPDLAWRIDQITEWARPMVERVRAMFWGDSLVKYRIYLDAVGWLEQRDTLQIRPTEEEWRQANILRREIDAKIRDWETLTRTRMAAPIPESQRTNRRIFYRVPPDGDMNTPIESWSLKSIHVHIDPDYPFRDGVQPIYMPECQLSETAPLQLLEMVAHYISDEASLSKTNVIFHILMGESLYLPPWRTRFVQTPSGRFAHMEVKIYTPDLTKEHMARILLDTRRAWNRDSKARMTESDYSLVLAVRDAGGVPPVGQGVMSFWMSIAASLKWNVGWQGLQYRYNDLMAKLYDMP